MKLAYDLDELAEQSGLGKTKIYQEIAAGRLRAVKCGKSTRVTDEDARSWLRSLPALKLAAKTEAA